jgi:hypothetical protein
MLIARADLLMRFSMILHVLLGATEPLDGGAEGDLRALLPILSETLLERQAQDAAAQGATRFMIRVGLVPAALIAAADRLRARGLSVEFVRGTADILAQIGPLDRLLIIADGLQAGAGHYAAICASSAAQGAVLVTGDSANTRMLERIDAQDRWAGLALMPGNLVKEIADVPDDWDPASTLLRQIVQTGAQRRRIEAALFDQGHVTLVTEAPAAALIEAGLMGAQQMRSDGLGQSLLWGPVMRLLSGIILRTPLAARHHFGIAALLILSAMVCAYAGWLWSALALGIFSGFFSAAAQMIQIFRAAHPFDGWARTAALLSGLSLISMLGFAAHVHQGETAYLAALSTLLALLIAAGQHFSALSHHPNRFGWALPDNASALILCAAGAALMSFGFGLIVAIFAACAGLFWWLDRAFRLQTKP